MSSLTSSFRAKLYLLGGAGSLNPASSLLHPSHASVVYSACRFDSTDLERLDFSCAFFGHDGGLVSNAPHTPVHLGAIQDGVQYQMWAIDINKGDCILSNHPCAEGVHLPDLTVKVTAILMLPGDFARCSGTHNLHGNLADLRALVAANQKGIHLVQELISCYGLDVAQAYMAHIQHLAEVAVRNLLRDVSTTTDGVLRASDKMDDGSVINLRVEIDLKEGGATFDFEGTPLMVINNLNAPRAITKSAIIYSLKCMVGYDVPLNQGCLAPIHLLIPK
ncbi:unnamed protein product [Clavelina lepadiformis]|uniref:Hydantoinase B/oxoprolinase domain-containing protein n=1 Tax=Clavelina lepadiformis TaxID=159417 RepID=A0ABP0G761_CLALP